MSAPGLWVIETVPDGIRAAQGEHHALLTWQTIRKILDEDLRFLDLSEQGAAIRIHADDCELHMMGPTSVLNLRFESLRAALDAHKEKADAT